MAWWILPLFLLNPARAQEKVILEWQATYFGPDTLSTPVGLAADRFGSIYVTGYIFVAGVRWDRATAKYTSVGEQVCVDRTPHPENFSSFPVGVIVDNDLLYVGSHHGKPGAGGGSYQSVIQYDLDGNQGWLTSFEGRRYGNAIAIDVDGGGNIYLCGYGFDSEGRFGVEIAKLWMQTV